MNNHPVFPTKLHEQAAISVTEFFSSLDCVDTVLLVNSCARGQAVPESDLDFAILVKNDLSPHDLRVLENSWLAFASQQETIQKFKRSSAYAHIHLDIIDGKFYPQTIANAEPIDYFEVEVGNRICYALPLDGEGPYFQTLKNQWLPYYDEELRITRLSAVKRACLYDLDHIPLYTQRDLHIYAFDLLYQAFQKYLQALFISCRTYPIAYNKWVKYQLEQLLNIPDLYSELSSVLSINNLQQQEIMKKTYLLRNLINMI